MSDCIDITSLEHLPLENTLLINYVIRCTGTWDLYQRYTAYRNVCDSYWTLMVPNDQHPRHDDFPITVGPGGFAGTFAWNYGGIRGISSENFDENHTYLTQLTIFNEDCSGSGGGNSGDPSGSGNSGLTGSWERPGGPPLPPPGPPPIGGPPPIQVPPTIPRNSPPTTQQPPIPNLPKRPPGALPSGSGEREQPNDPEPPLTPILDEIDRDPVLGGDLFGSIRGGEGSPFDQRSLFGDRNNIIRGRFEGGNISDPFDRQGGGGISSNNGPSISRAYSQLGYTELYQSQTNLSGDNYLRDKFGTNASAAQLGYISSLNFQDPGDADALDLNQNQFDYGGNVNNSLNKFSLFIKPSEVQGMNTIPLGNILEDFSSLLVVPNSEVVYGEELFISSSFRTESSETVSARAEIIVRTPTKKFYQIGSTQYTTVNKNNSLNISGNYNTHYFELGANTVSFIVYDNENNIIGYDTVLVNILPFLESYSSSRSLKINSIPGEVLKLINGDKNRYEEFILNKPYGLIFNRNSASEKFSCVLLTERNDNCSFRISYLPAIPGDTVTGTLGFSSSKIQLNGTDYYPEAYTIGLYQVETTARIQLYIARHIDSDSEPMRARLYYTKGYDLAPFNIQINTSGGVITVDTPRADGDISYYNGGNNPDNIPSDLLSQLNNNQQRTNANGRVQFSGSQIATQEYITVIPKNNEVYSYGNRIGSSGVVPVFSGYEESAAPFPVGP